LAGVELLVTYNGSMFDVPMLQRAFPVVDFTRYHHIDLRFPLHRLGLKGGLKGVEKQLGLGRPDEIEGVDGYTAVLLWRAHRAGSDTALETLLRYCLEDVVNLKPLLAEAYNRLTMELPIVVPPIDDVLRPVIPHRGDAELVRSLLGR
jgi:uncharacterized protein YprB with RNaseH-like and TPR domain